MRDKRYNVFNQMHKGLRAFLFDTAIGVQKTDFAKPEAEQIVAQLAELLQFLKVQADQEDVFILAQAASYNPSLVDELKKDHKIIRKLCENMFDYISEWRNSCDPDSKEAIGKKILYAFNEFIAFNLYHFNREENELMSLLWKHYTDAEILAMENKLLYSINLRTSANANRWIVRSTNNSEVTGWLTGLKHTAPQPVFNAFLAIAEEELSKISWASVQPVVAREVFG